MNLPPLDEWLEMSHDERGDFIDRFELWMIEMLGRPDECDDSQSS